MKGIITPLATPLAPGGDALDPAGTRRLLAHVIAGGVAGVFILGSTGEGPSLSPALRRDFVALCCTLVRELLAAEEGEWADDRRDRFSILVGLSDTCLQGSIELASHAAKYGGATTIITQEELKSYVQHIAERTELPVYLYNMPALTKITFEIEMVKELAQHFGDGGRIAGIKDSSFDLDYISQLYQVKKELCPSWSILTGAEWHVAKVVRMGCRGRGSNIFPEAFGAFYEGAVRGNQAMEDEAYKQIEKLKAVYDMANGRFVKATKTCLSVLGICEESYALPLLPFDAEERLLVEKVVADMRGMGAT